MAISCLTFSDIYKNFENHIFKNYPKILKIFKKFFSVIILYQKFFNLSKFSENLPKIKNSILNKKIATSLPYNIYYLYYAEDVW